MTRGGVPLAMQSEGNKQDEVEQYVCHTSEISSTLSALSLSFIAVVA